MGFLKYCLQDATFCIVVVLLVTGIGLLLLSGFVIIKVELSFYQSAQKTNQEPSR